MQTTPRVENAFSTVAIGLQASQPNNFFVSSLIRPYFLDKSIDHQKLINPNKLYAQRLKFKKGDSIFHNGDDHQCLFYIQIGYIKVEHCLPNGQYQIAQFGMPGDLLGLEGMSNGKHHLDAYAISGGELFVINLKKLHVAMRDDPSLIEVFEAVMSSSLIRTQGHIFSLGSHSAELKLIHFLVEFRKHMSSLNLQVDTIRLPMDREELKSYLGMTIETLSRSFSFLEKKGYVSVKNRDITFLEYEKLELLLDSNGK